ncbi:MAG TPA: dihydropteroate synthase [Actinomycetota bacterium]|nr:dihydropteroate synthase [Actinomycetota bacterium]
MTDKPTASRRGTSRRLICGNRTLELDHTLVMGVLNVTPDSFSDGGAWFDPRRAVDHALEMVDRGADIVDVGGESTRPGASDVPEPEELRRVLPVVEALVAAVDVPVSIDTRKASVAQRALDAGATIVNDTGGEESDRAIDPVVAAGGAAVVVMHARGNPVTMRSLTDYADVTGDVTRWLRGRAQDLEAAGVDRRSIVLDPGFGFAKTPPQNLELLNRLSEVTDLGYPVLVGTSRKTFIGEVLDLPTDERIEGTMASVVWAISQGAHIVRVHDVGPMVRAARMADAIAGSVPVG